MDDLLLQHTETEQAWTCFKEWLLSPRFKSRAPITVAMGETSLFAEIESRRSQHWQWWKGDSRGELLRHLYKRVPEIWQEQGWASTEVQVRGRKRCVEHSASRISAAMAVYAEGHQNESKESTYKWAESILGESNREHTVYLVTISASVYREYLESVGPEGIEGMSREELSTNLGFSKPLTNDFVRWVLSTGDWEEKRCRLSGTTRRELRRILK